MAVHRLSGGRASAVVLIPVGVAVLLACGLTSFLFYHCCRVTESLGVGGAQSLCPNGRQVK